MIEDYKKSDKLKDEFYKSIGLKVERLKNEDLL
jgi:hypothetical protein